jgi:hypothetical protein
VLPVTSSPEEFDTATRKTTQEEEETAFEQLHQLFKVIDLWQANDEQEHALSVQPHSSLAADDMANSPFHVSPAAIHGIAGAVDHLHSPRMLQKAASLHTFAPFTLNRAAIEGAAVAIWLLAPRTRDERIRRRLALATQNARDFEPVVTTVGRPTSLSDRLDEIRDVARRRPSLDPEGIIGTPPGFGRIIREAGAETALGSDFTVICWKGCSGITHNRQWATVNFLDREELSRIANVRNLQMTAFFKNVLAMTAVSVSLSSEARRLFAKRATAHV